MPRAATHRFPHLQLSTIRAKFGFVRTVERLFEVIARSAVNGEYSVCLFGCQPAIARVCCTQRLS